MEVEVSRREAVLTLTLNRPDVLNAFDHAMHEAFTAAITGFRRALKARMFGL